MTTRLVTASKLLLVIACALAAPQLGCSKPASSTTVSGRAVGHATLALIPADTPYAWVTIDPMDPVLRARMWSFQDSDLIAGLRRAADGADATGAKLARAILAELVDGARPRSLSELGFAGNGRFAFYGLSVWPVLRLEVGDAPRVRAVAGRVLAAVGPQIRPQQREGHTYWVAEIGPFSLVIAVLEREAVIALVPAAALERTLPLLFGSERPATSLASTGKLRTLAERYGFTNDMIGFVDLRALVAIATGQGAGVNHELAELVRSALGAYVIPCRADLERIAAFAPTVVVGYRGFDEHGYRGAMYVETPPAFNETIARLRTAVVPPPATTAGEPPLIAISAGVDVDGLIAWLGEVAGDVTARPFTCPAMATLNTLGDNLTRSIGGGLPPMLRGLRGVSMVLDELRLEPLTGQGHLVVFGDQVQALVGFLRQLPVFAGVPAPALGMPVAVPVQQLGLPGITSVHLALGQDRLGVAVGPESAARVERAIAAPVAKRSPLLSVSYDALRLRERLPSDDPDRFGDSDFMSFDVDVDERGLFITFDARWKLPAKR